MKLRGLACGIFWPMTYTYEHHMLVRVRIGITVMVRAMVRVRVRVMVKGKVSTPRVSVTLVDVAASAHELGQTQRSTGKQGERRGSGYGSGFK